MTTQKTTKKNSGSEKVIERALVEACLEQGWECIKFSSQLQTGYPDRLIIMPRGLTAWVELKSTGCRPTAMQRYRHSRLRLKGHTVYVADSLEQVGRLVGELRAKVEGCCDAL